MGQPARIKVNANIGTSPLCNCPATEERKIKAALEAGREAEALRRIFLPFALTSRVLTSTGKRVPSFLR